MRVLHMPGCLQSAGAALDSVLTCYMLPRCSLLCGHRWKQHLASQPQAALTVPPHVHSRRSCCRCHEDMSLKLLDLAVEEASEGLPEDHFLRQQENIDAAKNMIMGVTEGIDIEKTWLYTIVNNRQSGVLPLSSLFVWWIPRCPVLSQHPGLCIQYHLLFYITNPYTHVGAVFP